MSRRLPIILEYSPVEVEVLAERVVDERKGDKEIDVKVKFQHAGVENINHRLYPIALLQREVNKINERITKGESVWGQPFHPKDGLGVAVDISHVWNKVYMEADGSCMGECTVLPTPTGKTIQVLLNNKRRLGMSSRGFGTTTEKTKDVEGKKVKYLEVNDDYRMETPGDWVVAPSVLGAGNIVEEINLLESRLNKSLDSSLKPDELQSKKEKTKMDINELKKDHPELYAQVETEVREVVGKESKENDEKSKIENKITELEGKITALGEEKKTLEERVSQLEEKDSQRVNFLRGLIDTISRESDVLPEADDDEAGDKSDKTEDTSSIAISELKSKLTAAEEKITVLETKLNETPAADTKPSGDKPSETEVKDTQQPEKTEDKTEKVDTKPPTSEEASKVKENILKAGVTEVGQISSPEGTEAVEVETKLQYFYEESKLAGFKGDFAKWKETHPKQVESVTG